MLRIEVVTQSESRVELRVDGWIASEEVALLAMEISRRLQQGGRLVLDLEGVEFIDEAGIALLAGWPGEQLELRGGSVYLRMLLNGRGSGP
ncbi:MAG: STAS domain-containing protein [Candidatus Latescibacteria bacterium]|nr:STAS domain-containing protein [Candidatus Latescibacterota bacterium]